MKIPYIKIPIADIAAYLAPCPVETKGAIFQAVLNYGLFQKWDCLEIPEQYQAGYTAVQEIVENEIKNYKKFCKSQKEKVKTRWEENEKQTAKNKNLVGTAVLPEPNTAVLPPLAYQTETKTKADINNNKETTKKAAPEKKPTAVEIAFEDFWVVYPKKRAGSKEKAKTAFAAAVKRSGLFAWQIVAKAREYAKSEEATKNDGQFAKGAAAWLNDDRYLQSYAPSAGQSTLEQAREKGYEIINNIFGGK